MKIYLDTCSLQRPLDNQSGARVRLEAEAIISVLDEVDADNLTLVSSEALDFELSRITDKQRRVAAQAILSKASSYVSLDSSIEDRAELFVSFGVKPLDALHLACAEAAEADYFGTSDDQFLKKTSAILDLAVKAVSPLALIEELEHD